MRHGMRSKRRVSHNFFHKMIQMKILEGLIATGILFIGGLSFLTGLRKDASFSWNSGMILIALIFMIPLSILVIILIAVNR